MRAMGVLAVLVGAFELLNTLIAAAGVRSGARSASTFAIVAVIVIVSALLLGSGIALLVRQRRAIPFARGAAFACLVVFGAIAAIRPVLSIAATLLGIAFPIAMLLFLLRQRKQGSTPANG